MRWQHPERGLIPPADFIPIAQQTTLVTPLTMWVLNEALRQCRAWADDGLVLSVAVNLSPRNLVDLRLPVNLAKLLKKWRLAPSRIELEITETAIMSDPFRASGARSPGAMGVRLSIDDFGTYSSSSTSSGYPSTRSRSTPASSRNTPRGLRRIIVRSRSS